MLSPSPSQFKSFGPAITNRVQENSLRGGMRDTSRVNRGGKPFRPMRAIRGLGANVAINLGIWTLAESFRSVGTVTK